MILQTPQGFFSQNTKHRNAIIGGDFNANPWQRGTSFSSWSSGYTADRFKWFSSPTAVVTISQDTSDVPSVALASRYVNACLKIACTTSVSSVTSGDIAIMTYFVEGYDWTRLAQRPFTLSFMIKATVPGIYCIGLRTSAGDRSIVKEYTINSANTWERKTISFPASPSGGTWSYTSGLGVSLNFIFLAGATYATTPGSWVSANALSTSNQVNGMSSTSNVIRIADIQLEEGGFATPFEGRSISDELLLCQRYYEKSYDQGVNPATLTTSGVVVFPAQYTSGTGSIYRNLFAALKRAQPTMTIFNPQAAGNAVRNLNQGTACTTNTPEYIGTSGFTMLCSGASSTAVGDVMGFHFTADADF